MDRRFLFFAVLTAVFAIASVTNVYAGDRKKTGLTAIEVATQVQALYDNTTSYQARFRQTYRARILNVKRDSTGMVHYVKPGKISFRYDEPSGNRVVSDGKSLKIYERNNKQMYLVKVNRSQYPAALSFLFGDGKLVRDFRLRLLDPKRLKVKNGYVLEGIPRDATPSYDRMLLYVDGRSHHVRRVLLLDAFGNRNRFDFKAPRLNKKIPDSEFRFRAPPGTTIIRP